MLTFARYQASASVSVERYFHLPARSEMWVLRERRTFPRLQKMMQSAQMQAQQITLDIHEATGGISPPPCKSAGGFAMRTNSSKWCSGLKCCVFLVLTALGLSPRRE